MNNHQLIIIGRLGQNPDLKYTRDQIPVCSLSLAEVSKETGKPQWHKVVVWGKQAERCKAILSKGCEVFVRGRKTIREFQKENGEQKKYEEITAERIGFIEL